MPEAILVTVGVLCLLIVGLLAFAGGFRLGQQSGRLEEAEARRLCPKCRECAKCNVRLDDPRDLAAGY